MKKKLKIKLINRFDDKSLKKGFILGTALGLLAYFFINKILLGLIWERSIKNKRLVH